MLSRIAESLFWIRRCLERAEDTSRLLKVYLTRLLEDPVVARESARRSRETVSTEMWGSINTTWNMMSGNRLQHLPAHRACQLVRERCAVGGGIADSTMSHDEGWHYLVLGRSLERVDMTSRIIETAAYSAESPHAWSQTLRACGAHHAFVRTYRGTATEQQAVEFLLLDRLFPRSVLFSLDRAEEALQALEGGNRVPSTEALRSLGRARARFEYGAADELLDDLPERMAELQRTCSSVNDAVSDHFFDGAGQTVWRAGVH